MIKNSPMQSGISLFLLVVGIGLYIYHVLTHPGAVGLDTEVKVALGIAGTGLLVAPIDLRHVREAVGRRLTGATKKVDE